MAALALTVLLAILWVVCIAFGYWHGGWRQVVLLAAMLLSYAVVSEWAIPNGHDLSTQFHWDLARTTTTVALLYLLVGTVVLGVIGSFALYRPRPLGATERGLGMAMGFLNGGLVLALVLRTLRSDAFVSGRGETLHTSVLSRVLIEDVGYLLLAALLLGGIAAVVGIVATRRDDAREMALLASVGSAASATPAEPRYEEQPAAPAQSAQRPPAIQPVAPPAPQPIYAIAPLIDWPASPPPGIPLAPSALGESPKPDASPPITSASDTPPAPAPLPARPQLPPRVPPPMVYPVADLIAAQMASVIRAAHAPSLAASPPPPLATPVRSARPVGPPPGVMHPAVARERNDATPDAPSPVVREVAVTTQDVPIVQSDATPVSDVIPAEARPDTDGGTMHTEIPTSVTTLPPKPDAMMPTMAIPAIPVTLPPPLPRNVPPVAMDRPAPDEATSPRAGYARIAVARQASGRSDEPPPSQPQPSALPEPLRPPLPTGPRIHPCPTCGYPVRDHARYCPNCGSRQAR